MPDKPHPAEAIRQIITSRSTIVNRKRSGEIPVFAGILRIAGDLDAAENRPRSITGNHSTFRRASVAPNSLASAMDLQPRICLNAGNGRNTRLSSAWAIIVGRFP
jgi:hypothetical protein